MRRTREEAAETRARAVRAAARLVRARGIAGMSVADVMAEVDRTVGGFYRHFDGKDALVAEALEAASLATTNRLAAARERGTPALEALVDRYLSPGHRAHREDGCSVAALAADVARERGPSRKAFDAALGRLVGEVSAAIGTGEREPALHAVAALVGAVILSRAADDAALGDEIAAAVRSELLRGEWARARTRSRSSAHGARLPR